MLHTIMQSRARGSISPGEQHVANSVNGNEPDYYAVLAVAPTADEDAIRQAYRRLAREYHPDVAGEKGAEPMKRINAAYRVLSDPDRRREYDLKRIGTSAMRRSATPSRAAPRRAAAPPPPAATPSANTRTDGPLQLYRQIDTHDHALAALAFGQGDALLGMGFSDGRVEIWHLASAQRVALLQLRGGQGAARAGVLQEIRLSPSGAMAMAWGLNLGTHIWESQSGQVLWSAAFSGPSGAMDGILLDTPPMVRMALPAAPLALA